MTDRITDRDLQPDTRYTPRSTALRCGACGAPLDGAHRCDWCDVEVCPDCGCCECICYEVER